jgi:S1-C subfamily serine protease
MGVSAQAAYDVQGAADPDPRRLPASLTRAESLPHVQAMIFIRLAVCVTLGVALPAHAAKPPPLGADEPGSGAPLGKPPPLGGGISSRPPQPARGGRAVSSGTGFVVADGRALTNNHVVAGCRRMVARSTSGRQADARVLATDPTRDLSVLAIPAGFAPPLTFRSSPPVARGESVVVYGFPLSGLLSAGPTLTTGTVSALSGLRDTPLHYQISAPVQPGNSGGPLLDAQGHVIGVVVSKLNAARVAELTGGDIPQNVNFAIKSPEAVAFLRQENVEPASASSLGPDKSAADIGRIADASTLYLQCYK